MLSKRTFLKQMAASSTMVALSGCQTTNLSNTEIELGLNEIAKSKGLRFGNAIAARNNDASDPFNDQKYMDLVKRECGCVVAENAFKRYTIQPVSGDYRFERPDRIAKFAAENDLGLRGHALLWNRNEFLPNWVQELDLNIQTAEDHIRTYFSDVISHFGDQVYSWDVVNETIDPVTGRQRDTIFNRTLGADFIDLAFRIAREHAPNTQLVYNDYMSWETHSRLHRRGVLDMLADLRKRGTPIDALGVQGHIGTFTGDANSGFRESADREDWVSFLQEVEDMGFDVIITEFDVNDEKLPADIGKRDQIVADFAKDYLDRTLSFSNVKEVLTWGLVDQHSWLQEWWPREDALPKRPTPYDRNYQAKPLRTAIAQAMVNAPSRNPFKPQVVKKNS